MRKVIPFKVEDFCLTAIVDGERLVLIDCGYPGYMPGIERELQKEGVSLDWLEAIIITHHDPDHIGGIAEIIKRYPQVKVLSSAVQVPYITGEKRSLRLGPGEEQTMELPEKAEALDIGAVYPILGGIEIVDTNGHLPGHISVYIPEEKILAAGDALVLMDGGLRANPLYTLDMAEAVNSVKRLLSYDIEKVICYHNGVYEGNVKEAMKEMIEVQG